MPKTMFEKIWNLHLVHEQDGNSIIYIDRHLVHEVTSPQAFEGLRLAGRRVLHPEATFAVPDHNIPTVNQDQPISDPISALQVETLRQNCKEFGITLFDLGDERSGIVHVMGPEQGLTLPGSTIVCGDSHTATHGAFGSLAFGIGTSEVEHVLATQTLQQKKPKTMLVQVEGVLSETVTPKDIILAIIGKIGIAGGSGCVIEYAGETIRSMTMEGRMTLCNMTIEAGARAGMVAPDEKTFEYFKNKPMSPKGDNWEKALSSWKKLPSDPDAEFDITVKLNANDVLPQVTWGTNPGMVTDINSKIPDPENIQNPGITRALEYMGLVADQAITDIHLDRVFIGSCTNSRIEDLRSVAEFVKGRQVNEHVSAMIVPGRVLKQKRKGSVVFLKLLGSNGALKQDVLCV